MRITDKEYYKLITWDAVSRFIDERISTGNPDDLKFEGFDARDEVLVKCEIVPILTLVYVYFNEVINYDCMVNEIEVESGFMLIDKQHQIVAIHNQRCDHSDTDYTGDSSIVIGHNGWYQPILGLSYDYDHRISDRHRIDEALNSYSGLAMFLENIRLDGPVDDSDSPTIYTKDADKVKYSRFRNKN